MSKTHTGSPLLPISLPLRLWIAAEVVFGVMSIFTISLTPQNTAQHFSWPIAAHSTAALLGGFYLAAASFFVLALFARHWENIRVFVPASIVFSTIELLATFIHWDKFAVGTLPFNVWFVSYLLPPPLFIYFYWWHERKALKIPQASDQPIPANVRLLMQGLGALLAVFALAVFLAPGFLVASAPLAFTPLTARAFSGWVMAMGLLLLLAARENDRTRARLISPFFALTLPFIAIELWRFPDQLDTGNPLFAIALAVLVVVSGIGIYLMRGDWRKTLT